MKMNQKAGIYILLLGMAGLCAACAAKKTDGTGGADTVVPSELEDNAPSALDVILGESDEDLLVMGEQETPAEKGRPGENGIPIEGEGAEIIPGPVIIFYNSPDFSHLMYEEVSVSSITPERILMALAAHNIVTIDTKHNAFGMQDTEDGQNGLFLDLNGKFGDYMGTMSQTSEEIILAALADTFLTNYNGDLLYLTVEGEPLKTYRNTYKEPFTWSGFEVEKDGTLKKQTIDKKSDEN